MLRSIYLLVALAGVSVLATIPTTSCSNTTPKATQFADTIHLVTLSPVIAFHSDSTADSIPIWLSCSCRSTLRTLGSGGDTFAFSETSRAPDTEWIIPHYLRFAKLPGMAKHLQAWYAFSAQDHYGQTDYDTIRVTFDAR